MTVRAGTIACPRGTQYSGRVCGSKISEIIDLIKYRSRQFKIKVIFILLWVGWFVCFCESGFSAS